MAGRESAVFGDMKNKENGSSGGLTSQGGIQGDITSFKESKENKEDDRVQT